MLRTCTTLCLWLAAATASAATLWIEGEKPNKSTMNRHPWWYDQVKRDQFSGGDFLSNFHDDKPGEASYSLNVPAAGEYEFWVRANPIQARLSYQLEGGKWTEIELSQPQQSVNVAADGKPDLRFLAWFRVGKVKLAKGATTVSFRMHSDKHNHGYLDCFVLTTDPFAPRGKLKPDEMAAELRKLADENKGWFPFQPPAEKFAANSGFDLRGLNEAVAGEGGRIVTRDGQFIHSKSGKPVRFWAVNGPPHGLQSYDALRANARLLAKYGVNMVRIHGGIYDESGRLKPEEIRRRQTIVQAMKQEGIYSHLSIYFPLWLKPKPDTPWLEGYDGQKHPFAAIYFNPDFQRQYRDWWKVLLTTPDGAGRRLLDDPAVAAVELVNEDSYFFWTFADKNLPDAQWRIVERQFGEWLKQKYGSLDALQQQWGKDKLPRDDFAHGRVAFRPLWNMFNQKTARDRDTAAFLVHSQQKFYRETVQYLRELGFKGLITASNWHTASPEVFGPLERYTYTTGDFIDRHGYFSCHHKGEHAAWSIRNDHTYADRSALRFEPEEPGKPRSFGHPAMEITYDNKPTMISETTWCRPNRYRSEAPLYYAAYGALQDTDAIVHFALDGHTWSVKPQFFMQPWTLMSPAMVGQFPAAALIYRQGLVATGEPVVELDLKVADLLALRGTPMPEEAALDELRAKDLPEAGMLPKPGQMIDPLVHFVGRTSVRFSETGGPAKLADLRPWIDRKQQVVRSATKQLKLDWRAGVLTIDTPQAQAVSGNVAAAGDVELSGLAVRSDLDLLHVAAVSLDGQPLVSSRRILLQVMSEEKPTRFRAEPAGKGMRILDIGEDPWLVRELRGTVSLKRPDAASLKVTALDHAGYPTKAAGHAKSLSLLPDVLYYLLEK